MLSRNWERGLGILLILGSLFLCGLVYFQNLGPLIEFLLLIAALDLSMTVFHKPLLKPGPIAKFLYPEVDTEDGYV